MNNKIFVLVAVVVIVVGLALVFNNNGLFGTASVSNPGQGNNPILTFDILDENGAVTGDFSVTPSGQVIGLSGGGKCSVTNCDPSAFCNVETQGCLSDGLTCCDLPGGGPPPNISCHTNQIANCFSQFSPGCEAANCIKEAIGHNCELRLLPRECPDGGSGN